MDLVQSLKEKGWYLLSDAVQQISEDNSITNIRTLHQKAIDLDLREIGAPAFPDDILKGKLDSIPGNIIVQVQKVRNLSAPKANEESHAAPRMLKIAVTDGHTVCQAIEVEQIAALSLNTPPGTKLRLKKETVPMSHGMILLEQSGVEVLGGRVTQLVDKWELNRSLAKHTRGRIGEEGGPPPWIPFGQKIARTNLADRNFKSLDDSKGGGGENKENAEFEAQRKDAIAEAARAGGGARKVFGGGNARSLVDKNVKQIVEHGFTAQQAEHALHATKNNVSRALRMLQKKEVNSGNSGGGGGGPGMGGGGGRGGRRRGGGDKEDDGGGGGGGGGGGPKPSGKVSLFDFLEDKLPAQNGKEADSHDHSSSTGYHHTQNSRHQHSSGGSSNRGGGGGYTSGGGYNRGGGNTARHDRNQHHHRGGGGGNHGGGGSAVEPPPRNRDDRTQNQKPPRFQNQQHHHQQQQQQQQQRYQETQNVNNWATPYNSSDNSFGYDSCFNGGQVHYGNKLSGGRGVYEEFNESQYSGGGVGASGGSNNNRQRQQGSSGSHATQQQYGYNDYRRRYNNSNVNNYRTAGSNDNYTQQLMDAGMPEIPEFPFKDTTSIPPLMSAGFYTPSGFLSSSQQPAPLQSPPSIVPPPQSSAAPVAQYASPSPATNNKAAPPVAAPEQIISWQWKVGDKCMAKYWETNMYYNAEVTGLSKNTCVVKFRDYGNYEEVLQDDCLPVAEEGRTHPPLDQPAFNPIHQSQPSNTNHFSGSIEFRRGGTRPYVKSSSDNMDRSHNRRFRGSQQVYVPPAQRKEQQLPNHRK